MQTTIPALMPVQLNRSGNRGKATGSSRLAAMAAAVAVKEAYLKLNFSSGISVFTFLLIKSIRV